MEHQGNGTREQIEGGRKQDPVYPGAVSDDPRLGEDGRYPEAAAGRGPGAQGSPPERDVPSWANWQSALYLVVLGWICLLPAPLTSFWWLALVCGTAMPIAMTYALHERDRYEAPSAFSTPLEPESDGMKHQLGAPQQLDDPLSERELEVLSLLASGRTNSEVASDLFVSVGTIKSHTGNIYRKLDAKNRAEALARARELKVLR